MKMVSVNKLNNSVRNAKFAELSRKKKINFCSCINVLNDCGLIFAGIRDQSQQVFEVGGGGGH